MIRTVERDDLGQIILKREREATKDDKRQQMYDQLISPGVKSAN